MQFLLGSTAFAQATEQWRSWNQPVVPFRIADNLYYVGTTGIASYLITTPQGHFLIDGGFAETASRIRSSIANLGFQLEDVQILLNSHAHFDHSGGLAELAKASGARVLISEADADVIESGGATDFFFGDEDITRFPPLRVDHRLRDREEVTLGGITLTTQITAGHTRGCTSWSMHVEEGGKVLDVVMVCSTTILAEFRLLHEPSYPGISEDFAASFERLNSLPCDIFLASHPFFFHMAQKIEQRATDENTNPFIDPEGYKAYVRRGERKYWKRLAEERQALSKQEHSQQEHSQQGRRTAPAKNLE
jgi:metallo-beta-lactamase class B